MSAKSKSLGLLPKRVLAAGEPLEPPSRTDYQCNESSMWRVAINCKQPGVRDQQVWLWLVAASACMPLDLGPSRLLVPCLLLSVCVCVSSPAWSLLARSMCTHRGPAHAQRLAYSQLATVSARGRRRRRRGKRLAHVSSAAAAAAACRPRRRSVARKKAMAGEP